MPTWLEEILHSVFGRSSAHDALPDLRHLVSARVELERTHYLVDDRERRAQGDRLYVLRRDVGSKRDDHSIAVFSNGRGVGYLPDRASREIAPLLDQLGGAAVVNGAGAARGSIRLRLDLPTRSALRVFATAREA